MVKTRFRRLNWSGVSVSVVAALLFSTFSLAFPLPAYASHWTVTSDSYMETSPYDPASADAYVKVAYGNSSVWADFDAYDEFIYLKNNTSKTAKWHLYVEGASDPSGYLNPGECLEWGGSSWENCTRNAGWNISEGTPVTIEVCAYTSHGWQCGRAKGVA